MSGMFFLLFLIAVELFWPEGRNVIRGLLFSGDAEVAAEAMEELTVQLKLGMPVKDALVVFGRQILEGSSYAAY